MTGMIRKFTPADIEVLMEIWLQANCQAHSFIPPSYWEERYEYVGRSFQEQRFLFMRHIIGQRDL